MAVIFNAIPANVRNALSVRRDKHEVPSLPLLCYDSQYVKWGAKLTKSQTKLPFHNAKKYSQLVAGYKLLSLSLSHTHTHTHTQQTFREQVEV